jgi:hypothetical protein
MAIFTPRGLKIRLSKEESFSLMYRVTKAANVFNFLKTVEGIDTLPIVMTILSAYLCLLLDFNLTQAFFIVLGIRIVFGLLNILGIVNYNLVRICKLITYFQGFGILTILLGIVAYFVKGINWVYILIGAKFLGDTIIWVFELYEMRRFAKYHKVFVSSSERNFFTTYKLYAKKAGVTQSVSVSDEEIESGTWKVNYAFFELTWPEVTRRFTEE